MSESLFRDLQRVYLGKAHDVSPYALKMLMADYLVVFSKMQYWLTEAGDLLRIKFHKEGMRDTSMVTLGELIAAKKAKVG